MIADLWDDTKQGDLVSGTLLAILALVAGFILWIAFNFTDSSFLSERLAQAEVIGVRHSPGHFQPQVISAGKATTTTMMWIPDSWSMSVSTSSEVVACPISKEIYEAVEISSEVNVRLVTGRFSGKIYCNGIVSK